MDFQSIADSMTKAACVVSVEKLENDNYGKIRIVTGNRAYLDTIERPFENVEMLTRRFVPNSEYTCYLNRDLNFEDSCYQAAVHKKLIHAYAHPERFDVWFNMSFLPLSPDDGNLCYCLYIMEVNFKPDAKRLSIISADIASAVLETCIKLRTPGDFRCIMQDICEDVRALCDSENCCILLMDQEKQQCSVLCEALSPDTQLLPLEHYLDEMSYTVAESLRDTIAGSNCLIIKNPHDMEVVRERNPIWHHFITQAGTQRLALFPLEFSGEHLGYIYAVNFSDDKADSIKETLELTTFILASEIYSFRMLDRLHVLSSTDMLTGVMNRNEMNNYVDQLARTQDGQAVGVLFADLNGLKRVNDTGGHTAGDRLLKEAAAALREVFAPEEIFRAGGDEFVVIVKGVSEEMLAEKNRRLRDAAASRQGVSFAVGTAISPDAAGIRTALREADARMYIDKNRYYQQHPEQRRGSVR